MKAFLEEYGLVIVICLVVVALCTVAVFLKTPISSAINDLVEHFGESNFGLPEVTEITD